jgi:PAS domain S-box-containing protein
MLDLKRISLRSVVASIAIAAAGLAFDLSTPLGIAGGIPYVGLVLCGLWARDRDFTYLLAVIASLLTVAGYFLSPEGGTFWVVMTNRGLALIAIWATALVTTYRIRESEWRERNQRNLSEAQRIAGMGSWDWDIAASTLVWSDQTYRIFGLRPQQFGATYEAFLKYVHPDDRKALETAVQEALDTGKRYEIEHRVVREDGSLRYVIERGEVYFDAAGKANAMRGTVRDITEDKKKDARLAEVQRLAKLGYWSFSPDFEAVSWSVEAKKIFGLEEDALPPANYEEFATLLHPEDRDEVMARNQTLIQGKGDGTFHFRAIIKGETKYVLARSHFSTDEAGEVVSVFGTMQDVTEQKLIEQEILLLNKELEQRVEQRTAELREQMEFSERLIDTAQAIILVLDTDGRIKQYNRYLEELSGFSLAEVAGKSWFDIFIPDDQQAAVDALHDNLLAQGEIHGVQNTIRTKSGKTLQIEWFNTTLKDSQGEVWGTLSVGQDITERLKLQAQIIQSSKLATLGEMATGIAHELNQPLGIIGLAAENLSQGVAKKPLDPEYISKKLGRIVEQVNRATKIIDHMRIFGRKPDATTKPVHLPVALEGVMTLVGQQLKQAGIAVDSGLPDDLPPVMGHRVQIEQVLLNLLNNAQDAVLAASQEDKGGEKKITISGRFNADENMVILTVSDSGEGISPEHLERVFEPFFTTKEINKGTGLGLSISYGIVSEMGGRISAKNTADGASFTLELPAVDAASKPDKGYSPALRTTDQDRAKTPG